MSVESRLTVVMALTMGAFVVINQAARARAIDKARGVWWAIVVTFLMEAGVFAAILWEFPEAMPPWLVGGSLLHLVLWQLAIVSWGLVDYQDPLEGYRVLRRGEVRPGRILR